MTDGQLPDETEREFEFAVECDDCGRETFMYERYCYRSDADRWDK